MERNHFRERCEVRMTALGISQNDLAEIVQKDRSRVTRAIRGDTEPAVASLRVRIEQILTGMCAEKRERMAAEIEAVRDIQCPNVTGKISVIMPEDMIYVVTEDGIPVGAWNPQSKTFRELDAAVLPVIGRRVK